MGYASNQQTDGKEIISSTQHGFTTEKSFLTNPIHFYNEMPRLLDEGRAVQIVWGLD